jgi:hypothetical protein
MTLAVLESNSKRLWARVSPPVSVMVTFVEQIGKVGDGWMDA